MAITYCNTTTDLTNAYSKIEEYKSYRVIDSWSVHSGSVYKSFQTGNVAMVFDDGSQLTEDSAIPTAAGNFYYDPDLDILYVWLSDSSDPANSTIEAGVDWDAFKTTCRNDAQELLEGYLAKEFVIPFRPIISPDVSYNSRRYDFLFIRLCALLTCSLIINRINPLDEVGNRLFKVVYNPEPEQGELPGMIQQILDGVLTLKIQRLSREAGGFNVIENPNNTATAYFEVTGFYSGSVERIYRVQIDTGGAPGTATYKLSDDAGNSFDQTLQATLQSGEEDRPRINVVDNIWVRFVGTFTAGDYIDIHCFPATDAPTVQQIKQINLVR